MWLSANFFIIKHNINEIILIKKIWKFIFENKKIVKKNIFRKIKILEFNF